MEHENPNARPSWWFTGAMTPFYLAWVFTLYSLATIERWPWS